jgi:hypothetical protein
MKPSKKRALEDERGAPPDSSYWTQERLEQADELVFALSETDSLTAAVSDDLRAEYWTERIPAGPNRRYVRVVHEYGGVYPVVYGHEGVENAEGLSDIRAARGER